MSMSTEVRSGQFLIPVQRIKIAQNQDLADHMITEYLEGTLPPTEIPELCAMLGGIAAQHSN